MHRFHSAMFATFRRLVITAGVVCLMASALPAPAAAADAKSDAKLDSMSFARWIW